MFNSFKWHIQPERTVFEEAKLIKIHDFLECNVKKFKDEYIKGRYFVPNSYKVLNNKSTTAKLHNKLGCSLPFPLFINHLVDGIWDAMAIVQCNVQ